MININLVPEELIKRKQNQVVRKILKSVPAEVIIGAIGGSLAAILIVNVLVQLFIFIQFANLQRLQITSDLMFPERRQVNEVLGTLKAMREKIDIIESIASGRRASWAQKLNRVSDLAGSSVWLDRVALDKDSFLLEGQAVSANGDQLVEIDTFQNRLKSDVVFMKGLKNMNLALGGHKKEKMVGTNSFIIKTGLAP